MNKILIDGVEYAVVHDFGGGRIIANYEGLFVLCDQIEGARYELSGEPARMGEEQTILKRLVDTIQTTTTTLKGGF